MLSRIFGRGPDGRAAHRAENGDAQGFERISAVLDGRPTTVFVTPQGTAAAIEMGEERALILTGLAAGTILSDIEDMLVIGSGGPAGGGLGSGGLGFASARADRLSAREADATIARMDRLTEGQREQLRLALSLTG